MSIVVDFCLIRLFERITCASVNEGNQTFYSFIFFLMRKRVKPVLWACYSIFGQIQRKCKTNTNSKKTCDQHVYNQPSTNVPEYLSNTF